MDGWILLHRRLKHKAWYGDPDYLALWVHLLLSAAWEDKQVMVGRQFVDISRGQLVTGRKSLSRASGISEKKVRTILDTFTKGQQLTIKSTNKYSIISITNYDEYQPEVQQKGQQKASRGPAEGQQRATKKELNESNEVKEKRGFAPPSLDDVTEYCQQRENHVDPQTFIDFYESKGWYVGKNKMKSWKAAVRTWEKRGNGNGQTKRQTAYNRTMSAIDEWERAQGARVIDGELVAPDD